jgi:hypothetical protein
MYGALDGVFAVHELELEVGFQAIQARLVNWAQGEGLSGASQDAYEGGLAGLIRVGPVGEIPGATKLVRVRSLDPVYRDSAMTMALWSAKYTSRPRLTNSRTSAPLTASRGKLACGCPRRRRPCTVRPRMCPGCG